MKKLHPGVFATTWKQEHLTGEASKKIFLPKYPGPWNLAVSSPQKNGFGWKILLFSMRGQFWAYFSKSNATSSRLRSVALGWSTKGVSTAVKDATSEELEEPLDGGPVATMMECPNESSQWPSRKRPKPAGLVDLPHQLLLAMCYDVTLRILLYVMASWDVKNTCFEAPGFLGYMGGDVFFAHGGCYIKLVF